MYIYNPLYICKTHLSVYIYITYKDSPCSYIDIYTHIYIIYHPYIPIAARPCEGVSGTCLHVQSTLARAAKWLLSRVPLEPKSGNQPISMDVYVGDEGVICFKEIFTGNPSYTDIKYIIIFII